MFSKFQRPETGVLLQPDGEVSCIFAVFAANGKPETLFSVVESEKLRQLARRPAAIISGARADVADCVPDPGNI